MTNPSKQKGTSAEVAVRDYLRDSGWPWAERLPTEGAKDRGDIAGLPICIEVKNCKTMDLARWIAEAQAEKVNAAQSVAVVWHKRRGKSSPGDWYVTMTGAELVELLAGLG